MEAESVLVNKQPNTVALPNVAIADTDRNKMSRSEVYSILTTVSIAVVLAALATLAAREVAANTSSAWILWLAVAIGGLGGLVHEIAQSGGKILFFERKLDGFYIGSLGGVVLGAVAGIMTVRGFVVDPTTLKPSGTQGPVALMFELFLAGLALKGVTEAAGGQAVPPVSKPADPLNPAKKP